MRSLSVLLALLPLTTVTLAAQQIAGDSGRVVLETRLGGDSAQATQVQLRRGATYRVEFRPAAAQLAIRKRTRDGSSVAPLDTLPRHVADSVPGWRTVRITAQDAGQHVVELTNPGVGTTAVRVVLMHRAPGDTLPSAMVSHLLYNETADVGPVFIALDSGQIYRIVTTGTIYLSPRSSYRAPVRSAILSTRGNSFGSAFFADYTGDYRVDGDGASFQVYQVEGDSAAAACVHRTHGFNCLGNPQTPRSHLAPFILVMSIPAMLLLDALFR